MNQITVNGAPRRVDDTATLADIRRLEGTGASGSLQAIERAAAALRARADELDARAKSMRKVPAR